MVMRAPPKVRFGGLAALSGADLGLEAFLLGMDEFAKLPSCLMANQNPGLAVDTADMKMPSSSLMWIVLGCRVSLAWITFYLL